MGQVLGFAHCKEAPSTASTTPDSTEGGNEEPDFPELQAAPAPPEEEEEDEDEGWRPPGGGEGPRGPPRELTFSYIAFRGGGSPQNASPPPSRCRRDPRGRGGRSPRLSSGPPGGTPPRGSEPCWGVRAPPKYPEEAPPPLAEPGGGLTELGGGAEAEEPPLSLAAAPVPPPPPPQPVPVPPPPQRGVLQPAPPVTPPDAPQSPEPPPPPPAPPDRPRSPAGPDGLVWELLYWRAPGRSALVLLGVLGALGCLGRFSLLSVGAYGALGVLGVTLPLRLHRLLLRRLRPPPPGQPCPAQWEVAVGLSPEEQQRWARRLARHLIAATRTLTRLFLVQSVPESLKFAFMFYLLTYVGAACNGLTLLGVGVICAFTFPVLYRHNQEQIDQYVSGVRNHLGHLRARIQAKLPSAKVKPQ